MEQAGEADVWAKDVDDVVYDTEVQKRNTPDLPKRSRLYNSLIDSNLLPPGTTSYKPLNDVYVIIITPFDLFGKGLYKYTFNMGCQEAPESGWRTELPGYSSTREEKS